MDASQKKEKSQSLSSDQKGQVIINKTRYVIQSIDLKLVFNQAEKQLLFSHLLSQKYSHSYLSNFLLHFDFVPGKYIINSSLLFIIINIDIDSKDSSFTILHHIISKQALIMKSIAQAFDAGRYDHVGFNIKRKAKKVMRIAPLGNGGTMQAMTKMEQELLREIADIDNMLQGQGNLNYVNGFLVGSGATKQLLRQFHSALQLTSDAVQQGFYLWRLQQGSQQYQLVSTKLVNSPRHFPEKLLHKSIQKLQQYNRAKYEQSLVNARNRWNHSVKPADTLQLPKIQRFKTEPSIDKPNRKISQISIISSQVPKNSRKFTIGRDILTSMKSKSTPFSLLSPSRQTNNQNQRPSLEELASLLKKQSSIVSIWAPPSSCPQFLGVMSTQIKQKSYNSRYLLIKKYYWCRYSLSRRFFDSILRWCSLHFDQATQLQLLTTRQHFNTLFSLYGWKISGWINEDKVKLSFTGL